ncbi:cytochrome c oxidase subunit 6B [Colletotrichum lupini]|uniref:Cytochrome c oxidase subunit 12, mitochondrial n=14 Tax=Colletotrichum TaxID=5455 RepID=A0A9Q8SCG4_9PEZI|nr:cytochrome c oxidase subunit 6B [Colletotrichum lupini]UQC74533.1 cytochrome c oxidase subunit 6B [Colletotrichum lupini]
MPEARLAIFRHPPVLARHHLILGAETTIQLLSKHQHRSHAVAHSTPSPDPTPSQLNSQAAKMSDDQELVTKPFKFVTGTDARYPNMNQTKHCWQNYVDYHKCINAKGEDFAPCRQFWLGYRSLCPSGWYTRWDEQREAGNFPVKLDA